MKLISLNTWGGKVYKPLMTFIKNRSQDMDIFCFQEVFNTASGLTEQTEFKLNLYYEIVKILNSHQGEFTVYNIHGIWVKGGKGDTDSRIHQSEHIRNLLDKQAGKKYSVEILI